MTCTKWSQTYFSEEIKKRRTKVKQIKTFSQNWDDGKTNKNREQHEVNFVVFAEAYLKIFYCLMKNLFPFLLLANKKRNFSSVE